LNVPDEGLNVPDEGLNVPDEGLNVPDGKDIWPRTRYINYGIKDEIKNKLYSK
jgi:hypothetical protein